MHSGRAVALERRIEGAQLAAPDLINAEVVHVFRRLVTGAEITRERGREAIAHLVVAPVERFTTTPLALAMWDLRDNLTGYDAAYVALARALGCPLLTTDRRLSRTPGLDAEIVCV